MTRSVRRDLYACAAVAIGASMILLVLAPVYRIEHFYTAGQQIMSNDQVGYLTSARWLADTGELRSHLIVPAHVREPDWRLYMPGHYYVLAAGHLLFGDGPVAWRMPAMISFVLSAVGVFLIGRRFYDRTSGCVAALMFVVFPPIAAFAFTAMPQLPFIAATVTALCIFAYLPSRLRPLFVPLLLAVPFLFRETGALLIIPMGLVMLTDKGRSGWRAVVISATSSVVLLYALLAWQVASGKGSLPLDGSRFNYANAFPSPSPPANLGTWIAGLGANVSRNFAAIQQHYSHLDPVFVSVAILCLLALLAVARGIKRYDLALGAGLLCITMVLVISVFYTWELYRGLRAILFTFPLLAVSLAPLSRRLGTKLASVVFLVILLSLGYWGSKRMARGATATDGARAVEVMEGLNLEDAGVLVAPAPLALDYVLRHYPLRWSFIPRNVKTLDLLAEIHDVRTIILRKDALGERLTERAIRDIGLVRTREFEHRVFRNSGTFVVFENPQRSGAER